MSGWVSESTQRQIAQFNTVQRDGAWERLIFADQPRDLLLESRGSGRPQCENRGYYIELSPKIQSCSSQ
jgi:hypothetical protein